MNGRAIEHTSTPLDVVCPECEAEPGQLCMSLAKRWTYASCRTVGIGMNGWRKTPHKGRVEAWRAAGNTPPEPPVKPG